MEEFRPIIVDSVVVDIVNHRMLTLEDFVVELGAYRLKEGKRTLFQPKKSCLSCKHNHVRGSQKFHAPAWTRTASEAA